MNVRKFLDTSALVKLYIPEPETPGVQAEVLASDEQLISRLTLLEFRSALYGMVREGRLQLADANVSVASFESDVGNFTVLPVDEPVWQRAQALLDAHAISGNLRPPDALQVACALEAHNANSLDAFVTTDVRQAAVAVLNGLVVTP